MELYRTTGGSPRDAFHSKLRRDSFSEDEVNIKLRMNRTIDLQINKNEKVKDLKSYLRCEYKLKERFLDLYLDGQLLSDNSYCSFVNNSTLDLVLGDFDNEVKLKIELPTYGNNENNNIILKVKSHYTVGRIRRMIQTKNIFDPFIDLVYNGIVLNEDEHITLSTLGINKGEATFNLISHPENLLTIYVKTVERRTKQLKVKSRFTTRDVKRIVGTLDGESVIDQQLSYNGKWLRDDETLASCFVEDESVLYLIVSIKIFIRDQKNSNIALDVGQDETVENVKKKYCKKQGMLVTYKFRLMSNGKQIDDERTLSYYGIQNNSVLDVEKAFGVTIDHEHT